ncbi:MAG TPA: MATE family efflux transporter [Phnomibacter sp.]|nr:MATE family efflux transporter [Phnomibacter sp.]
MRSELIATLRLSIPIIITNMAQIALGLIDSAMVGAISYKQLAASSLAINVISIPQIICIGLTMAISPLVAIARGRQDAVTASRALYNGVWLNAGLTLLVAIGCVAGSPLLHSLGQDPEVATMAVPYFSIMAWSLIPMIIFLSVKQFSDALEMTKTGMVLALATLPLNFFLNWVFIYGKLGLPRMELYGAGVATLITRILSAVVMIIIVLYHPAYKRYIAARRQAWHIKGKQLGELLHIGIPSGMQYAMEAGAFALSGIMVGWLGATAQAAHQIALNIASFSFMAALGLSLGGSIRVSHAYGRGDRPLMRRIGISTIYGGIAYGIFCVTYFVLLRFQLPLIFTKEPAVITMAASLLFLAAIFQISDSTQAIGVGLLRGIRDVKVPTLLVAIAYWGIGIPGGYWLAFNQGMGAAGIWLGLVLGLTASSVLCNWRFLRKTRVL